MTLQDRLAAMGQLAGRPKSEVERVIGDPVLYTYIGRGVTVARWSKDGYFVELAFDDAGICGGIVRYGSL